MNSRFANQTRVILYGIRSEAQKTQLLLRVKNVIPMVDPKRASHLTHSKKPWWRTRLKLSQSSKTDLPYRTIRSSNKREIIQATHRVRVPIVSKQADQREQYKYQTRSMRPAGTSSRLKPSDAQHPIGPRSRTTLYPKASTVTTKRATSMRVICDTTKCHRLHLRAQFLGRLDRLVCYLQL